MRSGTRSRPGALALAVALAVVLLAPAAASAQESPPTDLLISEYVEGSSNNKAIELFNGTEQGIDLGGYTLRFAFNGATTYGTAIQLAGTVAAGDVFVVADDDFEGAGDADLVSTSNFFNGDDTVVLFDAAGTVVDSIGQLGFDPGSFYGSGDVTTQNDTLRRAPDVCAGDTDVTDVYDPTVEWLGFPQDTFDGLGTHESTCTGDGGGGGGDAVVINEFSASTTGTDVEYVEVYGESDTDYSDLSVLQVEGDSSSNSFGQVIGNDTVGTTDGAGFWTIYPPSSPLQNGSLAILLVRDWNGSTDATGDLGEVVDAIGVNDGGSGDSTFGAPALTEDYDGLAFTPGGASRIPDGTDTDTASDWVRNDFDLAGIEGEAGTPVVGEAYNTPGAPNEAVTDDGGGDAGVCGDPTVTVGSVQGSGAESPVVGQTVEVEGVVVGDFQTGGFDGYYVQDTGDDDPATSDGIFVFDGNTDVAAGDVVHVTGSISEFFGMTQLTPTAVDLCDTATELPAPTELLLPEGVDDVGDFAGFERYEGMYVTFPQDLSILEYFNYDRFGEIALGTQRQFQPTAVYEPGSPEAQALAEYNATARITLDDGLGTQNPQVTRHPNGDPFTLDNRFRGGDLVTNATGVLDYRFSLYRIQPTEGADYTATNPRPDVPEVGGTLQVASFNVLNYFTTIDEGQDVCGPTGGQECRGADSAEELERQQAKIVAALVELDADVVGLIEIQNDDASVGILVDALNDALGGEVYDHVHTGTIGTDAIKVALVYKPGTVTPTGDFALLDESVDPRFLDSKNRPVLAQTFVEEATGASVTVAVNHLKSKGSSCDDVGDPEDPDGQGNCNQVRADAAAALADWMAADPTGTGADNGLIIGDLNSYDKEDPIDVLVEAGWTDLLAQYGGEFAYSYVFDGQLGYLDYALANQALVDEVTGAAAWHANADEPDLLDYDTSFKSDGQDAIYAPDPYRASDHDAVLVGLAMPQVDTTAPELEVSVTPDVITTVNHKYVEVTATVTATDDIDDDVEVELVSVTSDEPDNGADDGNTTNDIVIVSDTEFLLRGERSGSGDGRTYTITYRATDDAGNTTVATGTVDVPLAPGRAE